MSQFTKSWPNWAIWIAGLMLLSGCRTIASHSPDQMLAPQVHGPMPRELSKVVLPPYTVAPPDILIIEAVHIVPNAAYRLRVSDIISLEVAGTLPDSPLGGVFRVEQGGAIDLGPDYGGRFKISGLTLEEARDAILARLRTFVNKPEITRIAIDQFSGIQQIAGQHLVGSDGTVTLGSYGSVSVVGRTLVECRREIEAHLAQFLEDPEVSVDVYAYNSQLYYVITEGAGLGDQVYNFPFTGNETVLDAISNINGLTQFSSKQIWIARPVRDSTEVQILPVDWTAITKQGNPLTNYQVFPGDRVFVAQDRFVAFDNRMGKFLAPLERMMGFSLLGVNTVSRFSGNVLRGGGTRGNNLGGTGNF